jgi:hypothetical protein
VGDKGHDTALGIVPVLAVVPAFNEHKVKAVGLKIGPDALRL